MTDEEREVLDASRRYFNDGTKENRTLWKRATKAYVRALHLAEDENKRRTETMLKSLRLAG